MTDKKETPGKEVSKKTTTTSLAKSGGAGKLTFGFSSEQVELVKSLIAKGTTDDELKLFLYTAHRTGLDPLTKQIYCIKRQNRKTGKDDMTIQTGIDGYRTVAGRTGDLAGIDEPVYDTEKDKYPNKATVTVYRFVQGNKVSFTASARWNEYAPDTSMPGGFMWNKMPYLMLGKVAEALALRKAFPNDLTGVYTSEEMAQAGDNALPSGNGTDSGSETPKVEDLPPYVCSEHGGTMRLNPAGKSKTTGKDYKAFWSCTERVNGGYCKAPILNQKGEEVKQNRDTGEMELTGEKVIDVEAEDINKIVPGTPPVGQVQQSFLQYKDFKQQIDEAETIENLKAVAKLIDMSKKGLPVKDLAQLRSDFSTRQAELQGV